MWLVTVSEGGGLVVAEPVVLGLLFARQGVAAPIIRVVVALVRCHQGGVSKRTSSAGTRCATIPQLKSIRALHDASAGWSKTTGLWGLQYKHR